MPETFNRVGTKLTTTNTTTIYTAPNLASTNRAIILSCLIANIDGSNSVDITVLITNNTDTEITRIAHTITIPPDATLELIPNKLILLAGEKLRAIASAANDLDCTISVLEFT